MKKVLEQKIRTVLEGLQAAGALPVFPLLEIRVERPKEDQFGEYSSNVALMLAKQAKKNPMELAEDIRQQLLSLCHSERSEAESRNLEIPRQAWDDNEKDVFEKIEVAKPGYINFYLSQKALGAVIEDVLAKKDQYGSSEIGKGIKVNNEFISANPTGPLHLGNGRGGFFGDVLGRVFCKAGYDVTNEYYINDAGEQVLKLGHSVLKDGEAVYGGEYIEEIISNFQFPISKLSVKEVGEKAAEYVMEEMIKKTLKEKMNIHFDEWISEQKDIVEKGYVDKALGILKEKGKTFEQDGAVWLQTTEYGDDKDRVLVKSDSTKTYFASDCGYILHKMERGFGRIIETWGADHHGYVARFKAAGQALGFIGKIDFTLVQLVKLVKDGEEVKMSKRAGNVVTIDELIEKVGHDVARFFFLLYAPETQMNFDLGLAEERSQKNPIFYVQYAHARLSSILRKAEEESYEKSGGDLALLVNPKERELIRELLFFPELIETVAADFTVHRLPQYAIRLADKLHSFYADCRVLDEENKPLSLARLELIRAIKVTLAETLHLMGIVAPEKM